MEAPLFAFLGGTAVITALAVISARNPMTSALWLIGTFLSLAGVYVLLNAHFLAIIQVLIYAGAIMVLFLFVIMLLNLRDRDLGERRVHSLKLVGVAMCLGLFVALARLIVGAEGPVPTTRAVVDNRAIAPEWGGIEQVGSRLFSDYLLPFEIVSILLLVAVVGALLVAKKRI